MTDWHVAKTYEDILYHKADGIAKITINRPHKRNAFRPKTIVELYDAFSNAREDSRIGVVLFTGAGPHTDGKYAFCSGEIKAFGDMPDMWMKQAFLASTCWIYSD